MLRRIALASFAAAVVLVVACGHQVTPEPNLATDDNLAGKMVIHFRTNGPLNFNAYTYAIVIDTCGEGTPYPNPNTSSYYAYSYSFLLGGAYGVAFPALKQYLLTPGTTNSLNPTTVPISDSTTNLVLNSNGQGNEYELIFTRAQLDNPLQVAQPCPNISPAPTPSPVGTGAAPTPTEQPTTSAQQYWYFNFFSINTTNNQIVDSLGQGGPNDNTFNGVGVETGSTNTNAVFKATGGVEPSDPSAQIQGGEIDNYL